MSPTPLRIQWLLPGGRAGGRSDDGGIVELDRGVPGDVVQWREVGRRGRVTEGELVDVDAPSPDRRVAPCRWTSDCGGCDLAEIEPEARRSHLARVVARAFGVDPPPVVVPSPRQTGHRARIKLAIDGGRVGYRAERSHRLVEIDVCSVARQEIGAALDRLRAVLPADTSGLASVELRSDGSRVVASFSSSAPITGELRAALASLGDVALDGKAIAGNPRLELQVRGMALRASPLAFYQVNLEANALLVEAVVAAVGDAERVLDLYAGIGNLSAPLAMGGRPVVAVEAEGQATSDLVASAARLGLPIEVVAKRVEQFDPSRTAFDAVVLDPPRAGAGAAVARVLANRPRRVAIVACDPVSGARDAREAQKAGWRLASLTCFDLFPDTHHVETLAVLERGR
jgi:tRNA/tmRNA/rRNA uracil-C5-methylase (TrmA/RlmC/RlmD family)